MKKKYVSRSVAKVTPRKNRESSVGGKLAEDMEPTKVRSKSATPSNSPSLKSKSTEFNFGSMDPGLAADISVAVHAILEQHECYSMTELHQFEVKNHTDIPGEFIDHTILIASSAAWYVVSKFYLRESDSFSAEASSGSGGQDLAFNVILVYWLPKYKVQ